MTCSTCASDIVFYPYISQDVSTQKKNPFVPLKFRSSAKNLVGLWEIICSIPNVDKKERKYQ